MSIKKPMNKIEKLIDELCPDGVEFRALGEVGKLVGGSGLPKSDFTDSGVACIHYGQIYTHYGVYTSQTISFVSNASAERLKKVSRGDLIIAKTSENVEEICKTVAYLGDNEIVTGGHTAIFKHRENPKYLSYYINGAENFQVQKGKYTTGVKVKDVSLKNLTKFKIPIPPLTIQKEIVKILDNFTQLEAELEARKKQYEHYREALLSFDDGVEFRELGEIANFSQGIQVDVSEQSQDQQTGFIRFLRIVDFVKDDEPPRFIKKPGSRYVKSDSDLVMIRYGASAAGKVFLKYNGAIANNMFQIKLKTNELSTKFLYCYLSQTKIYNFLNSNGGSSTMPAITFGQIGSVKIPIPPLPEQKRIVAILDKFDILVNDISVGLPAEISARKKQYEYYRNQLLTFTPLDSFASNGVNSRWVINNEK